ISLSTVPHFSAGFNVLVNMFIILRVCCFSSGIRQGPFPFYTTDTVKTAPFHGCKNAKSSNCKWLIRQKMSHAIRTDSPGICTRTIENMEIRQGRQDAMTTGKTCNLQLTKGGALTGRGVGAMNTDK